MKRFINQDVEDYAKKFSKEEPELLQELSRETWQSMEWPQMLSGRLSGRFLKLLVQISRAKTVVEVGMFTGYATLSMAEALGNDGKIIACELDEKNAAFAQKYFARSPFSSKIDVRVGKALDTIAKVEAPIDLAFIDADKENYKNYYEAILNKMVSGGIIVIDNCLWSGSVLNPQEPSDIAIHEVNELVAKDERVENVILTVRDGLNLIRKK
ncbi:MAG: class I SAM-dependent methyltransferase [Bdellovibrionota bacterium]